MLFVFNLFDLFSVAFSLFFFWVKIFYCSTFPSIISFVIHSIVMTLIFISEITICMLYFDININLYFINNIKFDLTVII